MRTRTGTLLTATVLLVALVLPAAGASAQGRESTRIRFRVSLTSQYQVLEQVGRGGARTYGWNQLQGSASTPSGDVDVTILGNVDYVRNEGPFFGFLTVKFASMSTLGLRMRGEASLRSDGTTDLEARLGVVGGNAAMTGAKGSGRFTGERRAELGSPIEITVTLNLRGIT
jgi:hypothetical protein